jgi:hypothetical protein
LWYLERANLLLEYKKFAKKDKNQIETCF